MADETDVRAEEEQNQETTEDKPSVLDGVLDQASRSESANSEDQSDAENDTGDSQDDALELTSAQHRAVKAFGYDDDKIAEFAATHGDDATRALVDRLTEAQKGIDRQYGAIGRAKQQALAARKAPETKDGEGAEDESDALELQFSEDDEDLAFDEDQIGALKKALSPVLKELGELREHKRKLETEQTQKQQEVVRQQVETFLGDLKGEEYGDLAGIGSLDEVIDGTPQYEAVEQFIEQVSSLQAGYEAVHNEAMDIDTAMQQALLILHPDAPQKQAERSKKIDKRKAQQTHRAGGARGQAKSSATPNLDRIFEANQA